MKRICTVHYVHWKTVLAMIGAHTREIENIGFFSDQNIQVVRVQIANHNLSCLSVSLCHRCHDSAFRDGEVIQGEFGV